MIATSDIIVLISRLSERVQFDKGQRVMRRSSSTNEQTIYAEKQPVAQNVWSTVDRNPGKTWEGDMTEIFENSVNPFPHMDAFF